MEVMRLNERVKRLQAISKASVAPGTESIEETYRWVQEVLSRPDTGIPDGIEIRDPDTVTGRWVREIIGERRKQRAE
jgi:hypothetical protein